MPDDIELALNLIAGYLSPKTKPSKKEGYAAFHRIILEACEFLYEEGLGHLSVVLQELAQAADPDRPRVEFKGATQGAKSAHVVLHRDFLIAREVALYNRANGRGGIAFVAKKLNRSDSIISKICRKPIIKDMIAFSIDMDRTAEGLRKTRKNSDKR